VSNGVAAPNLAPQGDKEKLVGVAGSLSSISQCLAWPIWPATSRRHDEDRTRLKACVHACKPEYGRTDLGIDNCLAAPKM
jgi:hypothetical protein